MFNVKLLLFLAIMAMIGSIATAPTDTKLVGKDDFHDLQNEGFEFDTPLNIEDDQSPNDALATLGPRDETHFTFFRRRFYTKSCGPVQNPNCQEGTTDNIHIHTSCNGGGCGGNRFFTYDGESRLCDRKFKVCGTEYVLKYTGKEWSCMRLKLFAREGEHNGKTYANLMRGNKKVGTCKVYTTKRYGKSCSVFGASEFWSSVRCHFD